MIVRACLASTPMKWAVGGWTFFIAENLVLSENRSYIIGMLGDDGYHILYGTVSTAAMGSIVYGYLRKVRNAPPLLWSPGHAAPVPMKAMSFVLHAVGLGLVSQVPPKLQLPVQYVSVSEEDSSTAALQHHQGVGSAPLSPVPNSLTNEKRAWKVRCPFDFTDSRSRTNTVGEITGVSDVYGLDRISRHPGLWAFGLVGLGQACLVPSLPQRVWMGMPLLVALVGGWHTDSRHRRGLGGYLSTEMDLFTSNVPFLALIMGRQDRGVGTIGSFRDLADEMKVVNLAVATGAAALIVLKRGNGRSNIMQSVSRSSAIGYK